MAREQLSPWGDWQALSLGGLLWAAGNPAPVVRAPLLVGAFADDLGNVYNAAAQKWNAGPISATASRPPSRPTFTSGSTTPLFVEYQAQIAIPDFVGMAQRGRYLDWTGDLGDQMDPDGVGAGLNIGLQIENVLYSRSGAAPGAPGADLTSFGLGAQYSGYGLPVITPATGAESITCDTPVGGNIFAPGSGAPLATAFPDMSFPSDSGGTQNDAVTFGPDGVARVQHILQLPRTLTPGDMIDLIAHAVIGGVSQVMQWYAVKYRWITLPFPIAVNAGTQLDGSKGLEDAQPRQAVPAEDTDVVFGVTGSPFQP
jgi:hypothetical protein